eukprot:maker-scaffold465_size163580-snap-gene-0.20 protein:Tk03809 transcript:maker-scaffold465_size163580-snap-gene-0.20-mRNA-1 annotation:"diacetyl reductase"
MAVATSRALDKAFQTRSVNLSGITKGSNSPGHIAAPQKDASRKDALHSDMMSIQATQLSYLKEDPVSMFRSNSPEPSDEILNYEAAPDLDWMGHLPDISLKN